MAGQYISTVTGVRALGAVPQTILNSLPTRLFLMDTPLLRDLDDNLGQGIVAYWAGAPYSDVSWSGARLHESADAQEWTSLGLSLTAVAWGTLETALGDAVGVFHTNFAETIVATIVTGASTLATVTELQLANGANAAIVFKANGEVEVIQFLTVAALGAGRFQLTSLNRGMRGTDTMARGHAATEVIVMLTTNGVQRFSLPMSSLNAANFYRAVTARSLAADAVVQKKAFTGRDQKPYAPVNVAAVNVAGDLVLTWNRRARVNGALRGGTDVVPLGEATEAYDIDIYNAGETTVLRTLTATAETVTYLAANITTDLSGMPATLHVAVYQRSAAVGRGFGRIDAVTVT